MTQPFDPYQHSQQQAPAPGWAPPGQVPDPRQWQGYGQPVTPSAEEEAEVAVDRRRRRAPAGPGGTVSGDVCRQGPGAKGEYVVILDRTFLDPIRWKATL